MASVKITMASLPKELRRHTGRRREAVIAAMRRTAKVDAQRWIQWSIRGGGTGGPMPQRTVPDTPRPKRPKGAESPGGKPSVAGAVKAIGRAVRSALGIKTSKPKAPKPPAQRDRPKGPAKPPAGYRPPIDTGDYARSWKAEDIEGGALFYSAASPPVKAGVIEEGRRPGKGIPIEPLADWVRRQLGVSDPKMARGIAFAISMKQKRVGRPGLHVLKRAHPKIVEAAETNVRRELKRIKPGS